MSGLSGPGAGLRDFVHHVQNLKALDSSHASGFTREFLVG